MNLPTDSFISAGAWRTKRGQVPKGPTKNNYPFWAADPSLLAALLVAQIS